MEFKALQELLPETEAAVRTFLGDDPGEKFSLTNPCEEFYNGKECIKNTFVHFIVSEGNEILAYGELQCVIECNQFYVELKGEGEAGKELVKGMCSIAKEYGAVLTTPSLKEKDELLISSGMKCDSVDYMLVYKGNGFCDEPEEYQDDDLFDDWPDEDGACLHGIYHETGYIASSCFVTEYEDSICISGVCTDKKWRRQGYATRLIRGIISKFSGKEIMLHVYGENESAVSLYKKLGFMITESVYTYISTPDNY